MKTGKENMRVPPETWLTTGMIYRFQTWYGLFLVHGSIQYGQPELKQSCPTKLYISAVIMKSMGQRGETKILWSTISAARCL